MGFDKNKGVTLYNFTKHENAEAKSCCNFRIESDGGKGYTLNIKKQRRLVRDHRALFLFALQGKEALREMKWEKGNAK